MYVMGSGGDFLERSGNQEDLEIGKERGKACSSCFPENIRCMYVPVSWQVGSTAEGQMTSGSRGVEWRIPPHCLDAEEHPKLHSLLQWCATQGDIRNWLRESMPKSYSFLAHIINSSGKMRVALNGRSA